MDDNTVKYIYIYISRVAIFIYAIIPIFYKYILIWLLY